MRRTAALLSLLAFTAMPAFGQNDTTRIRGTIVRVEGNGLTGSAATTEPDGTLMADEVHIFPESMRGTGEGSRPYDLGEHSSMTNGTVDTVAAPGDGGGGARVRV